MVADAALGRLMRELFEDRIAAKAEMLRRLRQGGDVGASIVVPDADEAYELPPLAHDDPMLPTGVSQVGVVTPSGAAPLRADKSPVESRRGLTWGLIAIGALAIAGVVALGLLDPDKSPTPAVASAPSPPPPASEVVVAPLAPTVETPSPPSSVTIEIESVPSGAEVFVDDRSVGNTPHRLELERGTKEVVVKLDKPGFTPVVERIVPEKDQRLKLPLSAKSRRAPTKPAASSKAPGGYTRVP
jgi:hypothetical protein